MYITKLAHVHGSACPLAQMPANTFVKVNLYMDIHTHALHTCICLEPVNMAAVYTYMCICELSHVCECMHIAGMSVECVTAYGFVLV